MEARRKATEAAPNDYGDKDTKLSTQKQVVYQSFKERPKTMLDVSLETGILRANVCRYVAMLEEERRIQLLYKVEDEHTGAKAGYYTTDKALFRKEDSQQLTLFGESDA